MSCTSFFKKFIIYVQKVYKSIKCKFDNFLSKFADSRPFSPRQTEQFSNSNSNSTLFSKGRLFNYVIPKISQFIHHSSCVKLMICCGNLPVLARFCSRVKQNSRDVGRSKNFWEGVVIGRHNLPPG